MNFSEHQVIQIRFYFNCKHNVVLVLIIITWEWFSFESNNSEISASGIIL